MQKALVDTDVLYDLLAQREPFHKFSAELFTLADQEKIRLCVSALAFANLFYILSKLKSQKEARVILNKLKALMSILPVKEKNIDLALNSEFNDFEDAVQYYVAIENKINLILTRNLKDYKKSEIPILTPQEFLNSLKENH